MENKVSPAVWKPDIGYELRQHVEGDTTLKLYHNNVSCTCPYSPVITIFEDNRPVGQTRTACNTSCPLADLEIVADSDQHVYSVKCGAETVRRQKVTIKLFTPSPETKLAAIPLIHRV